MPPHPDTAVSPPGLFEAVILNRTLRLSPSASNTEALIAGVTDLMAPLGMPAAPTAFEYPVGRA